MPSARPRLPLIGVLAVPALFSCLGTAAGKAEQPPNFAEHVAPIVYQNCTTCHRPGEAGPFPLTNFEEVRKRGRMIARTTAERYMPPWHPAEGHGEFLGERRLSEQQISTLQAWVDADMPRGEATLEPPLPDFPEGWQLGEPDIVLTMPEPFEVPAEGRDIYRQFVLPALDLDEDQWVRAVEVRAGSRALHHVLIYLDESGSARELDAEESSAPGFRRMSFKKTGGLGGWAVGKTSSFLPNDLALPLPAKADIILAAHFHPTGKAEREATTIGIFLAEKPPEKKLVSFQLPPAFGALSGINIPPGKADYAVTDSITLPVESDLVTVSAHMHYIGRSATAVATLPDGTTHDLFHIPDWDFNWQDSYTYQEPVRLPAGTRIDATVTWDNSAANPHNQFDPPQRVRWGRESTDEMGSISFLCVAADESDQPQLAQATRGKASSLIGSGVNDRPQITAKEGLIAKFRELDQDGDGVLRGTEIPKEKAVSQIITGLDSNADGELTMAEAEAAGDQVKTAISSGLIRIMMAMDRNKDGTLSTEEIPERLKTSPWMKKIDSDGDGALSAAELADMSKSAAENTQ